MNPFQDLTDEDISIDNLKKILSVEKLLEYLAVIRDDTEWTKQNCPFFYNKPFFEMPVMKQGGLAPTSVLLTCHKTR